MADPKMKPDWIIIGLLHEDDLAQIIEEQIAVRADNGKYFRINPEYMKSVLKSFLKKYGGEGRGPFILIRAHETWTFDRDYPIGQFYLGSRPHTIPFRSNRRPACTSIQCTLLAGQNRNGH